ncbi:MAG: hypothetical protein JWN76_252 [Chitinophagaceae bacterium]|nr:hypothetical protein [Chitinophagaceae bacterium]
MRRPVTLLALSVLFLSPLCAQKLTGVWRGYFYDKTKPSERYRYEIQMSEGKSSELSGVTYSYKSTDFYGKSGLQGIHMKNNSIIFKEKDLLEVKISKGSYVCLMTCYLDLKTSGSQEILEGTYLSVKMKELSDCGSGYVYLEKVPEPIFKKEDFLIKKDSAKKESVPHPVGKTNSGITKKPGTGVAKNNPAKKPLSATGKTNPPLTKKPAIGIAKKTSPKKPLPPAGKTKKDNEPKDPDLVIVPLKPGDPQWSESPKTIYPVPRLVKERDNPLIKTIVTYSPDIKLELYDNGQIDNDTITVYHNNETVVNRKKLSYKALTVQIHADEDEIMHEFIVVANNLGDVPPNTALVVITTGGKRYEFPVLSDEKKNAKIVVQYVPKK